MITFLPILISDDTKFLNFDGIVKHKNNNKPIFKLSFNDKEIFAVDFDTEIEAEENYFEKNLSDLNNYLGITLLSEDAYLNIDAKKGSKRAGGYERDEKGRFARTSNSKSKSPSEKPKVPKTINSKTNLAQLKAIAEKEGIETPSKGANKRSTWIEAIKSKTGDAYVGKPGRKKKDEFLDTIDEQLKRYKKKTVTGEEGKKLDKKAKELEALFKKSDEIGKEGEGEKKTKRKKTDKKTDEKPDDVAKKATVDEVEDLTKVFKTKAVSNNKFGSETGNQIADFIDVQPSKRRVGSQIDEQVKSLKSNERNYNPGLVIEKGTGENTKYLPVNDNFTSALNASGSYHNKKMFNVVVPDEPEQIALAKKLREYPDNKNDKGAFIAKKPTGTLTDVGLLQANNAGDMNATRKGHDASDTEVEKAAIQLRKAGGRNWVPVLVRKTEFDTFDVVGNYFAYDVAKKANIDKIWSVEVP